MHGTARSDVILMLMAALAVIGVALLLGQVLTVHPTIDFTQVRWELLTVLIGIPSPAAGVFGYCGPPARNRSERIQWVALLTVIAFITLQVLAGLMDQGCPTGWVPLYSDPNVCVLI